MTDSQLLAEFVDSQSHEAFEGIVQRYIILVHGAARRMVPDEHLAQDVVQATFIVLLKKAPKVDPRTLPGWLVNTTRLVAREAMRAERTREKREAQIAATRSPIAPAGDEPDISRMMPMLDDALGRLSPEDRTAVVMRFLEGASFAQVAAIIGSTEDTARKRVARALDKLRKIFTKQGLVLNSAGLMGALAAQQTHAVPAAVVTATTSSLFTGGTTTGSHLARAILSARNWTKTITLVAVFMVLIIAGGGALFLIRPHHQAPPPPPTAAITAPAVQAAPPQSSPLWLKTFKVGPLKRQPILVRELYRQALLIAARDELGLQTRDESLREWRDAPPPDQTLNVVMQDTTAEVTTGDDETNILDEQDFPPGGDKDDLDIIAREAEALSRDTYVTMLKANHWSGNGNTIKPDGPAPADAEARLAELDELSQFAVLRETHELIRTDGETPQRLGVLIRAYGNLGRLTSFHWSVENKVFTARSLLYAQRLLIRYPQSAQALWLRAYAKAMAGLPQPALDDLDAADKLQAGSTPPPWVQLIRLSCQDQPNQLTALAAANPSQAPLATFLAYLAALDVSDHAVTVLALKNALQANPTCIALISSLASTNLVGSDETINAFSNLLDAKLGSMPDLPKSIVDQIQKIHAPPGNPIERETICQTLIAQGNPALDKGEPSWTALGRLIQETNFVLIEERQARLKSSDYTTQVYPVIAEHPFAPLIEALGLFNSGNTRAVVAKPLQRIFWQDMVWSEEELTMVELRVESKGPSSAKDAWNTIIDGLDSTVPDLVNHLSKSDDEFQTTNPLGQFELRNLRRISPHSPWVAICDIKGHWDPQMAPKWEAEFGDDQKVLSALGNKYDGLSQWTNAERCFRKCVILNPDLTNYRSLAYTFISQGKPDQYVATLKEFLARNPNSPGHALASGDIAEHFMGKHQYAQAIAYADAAADSGEDWAVQCAALAHTEVGDFDVAEKLMIKVCQIDHTSPFSWYAWCLHTGHGHIAAAKKTMDDYFSRCGQNLSNEDLLELAFLAMRDKRYDDAMNLYDRLYALQPSPVHLWLEANCADEMHDTDKRDQLFQRMDACMGVLPKGSMSQVIPMLEAAYRGGQLDIAAIDKILATEHQPGMRILICYNTARYLQSTGRQELANQYLRQCFSKCNDYVPEWLLIDQALRDQKIDPFLLSEPATRP